MGSIDYVIAGAGIIGLSLALELESRGASAVVLDAGRALKQTSSAAAGMLAVNDPLNPPALLPLAQLSASLYPAFLDRIASLSGTHVAFQTSATLEAGEAEGALPDPRELVPQLDAGGKHFHLLAEHSVDPRQLAEALLAAVRATKIELRENTPLERLRVLPGSVMVETAGGILKASHVIDCMGTWSPAPVSPRKGQMLAVTNPPEVDLACVVRTRDIYMVPRTDGPNAGRVIIGATIEDAGFDLTVVPSDILALNAKAVKLLPALADAKFIESWAGLRPSTADGLPVLGPTEKQPRYVLATGHFRNGILLAPATALVMAQVLAGETPSVDLHAFAPGRF